jgi:tRNA (adenine22-N1)-methyltransferase
MGADTMISILEAAPWLKNEKYRLILQCQSRRPELRKYLYENGFSILRETLAKDGKFIYPVTEVVYSPAPALTPGGYHITPMLLKDQNPLLPAFYERAVSGLKTTVDGLSHTGGEKYEHYCSVLQELTEMEGSVYGHRG